MSPESNPEEIRNKISEEMEKQDLSLPPAPKTFLKDSDFISE